MVEVTLYMEQLKAFDASGVTNEEEVLNTIEVVNYIITSAAAQDKNSEKEAIGLFLIKLHENVTSSDSSPQSKLMTMMIIREYADKSAKTQNSSKIFSHLASSKFYAHMRELSESVDPHKQIQDKGRTYFPANASTGNDYIRLILEIIQYLAGRYTVNKHREPTSYKKTFDALVAKKVTFPKDYRFFSGVGGTGGAGKQKRQSADDSRGPGGESTRRPAETSRTETKGADSGTGNLKVEINYLYNRILNFIEALDDDDISTVENEIRNMHGLVEKDLPKFQKMAQGVLTQNDENLTARFFSIQEFMNKQITCYHTYIDSSKDFSSYVLEMKLEAEKNFPQVAQGGRGSLTPQGGGAPPRPPSKIQERQKPPPPLPQASNPYKQSQPPKNVTGQKEAIAYFSRLEERSKSKTKGFRSINDSLSKQKTSTLRRSRSPITHSKNLSRSIHSLKESKLSPIFTNPPNRFPQSRYYEGRQVSDATSIGEVLRGLSKNQGLRRFKTANFKGKSSLFENEHIQIGYKSEPVYEQVSGFSAVIKIELFFGNLAGQTIHNLELGFKGDPNVLLYANPRSIDRLIDNGGQNRIDLVVVPLRAPFPLLTMNMRYKVDGRSEEHRVALPNSALKLAHFMDISQGEFKGRWGSSQVFKTAEFKLCHYLPPDSFHKWMPSVSDLTSYESFAAMGSSRDYEMFCAVIMLQKHQGLLKICIRPNLNVVLQVAVEDPNQEAVSYFRFFLESLQQLVREVV